MLPLAAVFGTGVARVSLLTEVLTVGGVAMDLVGAGVLFSHAHNAESIAEIRAEAGAEKSAVGEDDAIATHAQLLAEKRIGFFILTAGITIHLVALVIKSPEGAVPMGLLATGIVVAGLAFTVMWTKVVGGKARRQAREVAEDGNADDLPEHRPAPTRAPTARYNRVCAVARDRRRWEI